MDGVSRFGCIKTKIIFWPEYCVIFGKWCVIFGTLTMCCALQLAFSKINKFVFLFLIPISNLASNRRIFVYAKKEFHE